MEVTAAGRIVRDLDMREDVPSQPIKLTIDGPLQDYAALRAVSLNAARFLLKGIFRKTGATSQAQLVATLARLPVTSG